MSNSYDPALSDPTGQDIADAILLVAKACGGDTASDFETIRANVERGLGPVLYPVGYKFPITHSVYGTLKAVVVGHDQIAAKDGSPHTMTLLFEQILANVQFDATEAFYYCNSQLAAGTYHFKMADQAWYTSDNGKTFQFTLTNAVPAGGQLVFDMTYNQALAGKSVKVFATRTSTTASETATISEGSEGTDLGTMGAGNLNHTHRTIFGSNNYKESAMRQFLNSDAPAGAVWSPQTKFDRPPSWLTTLAGLKAGFSDDFLGVIKAAVVKCSANNTYEAPDSTVVKNTAYEVYDEFFLPSRYEVYASSDVVDGSVQMTYYVGSGNQDKIKLLSGSPQYWWLRTPNSDYAHFVRYVSTDGSLSNRTADGAFGCVPACIIA